MSPSQPETIEVGRIIQRLQAKVSEVVLTNAVLECRVEDLEEENNQLRETIDAVKNLKDELL